jgi:nucleoid-associated protein YgaU
VHVVAPRDTLWDIAAAELGDPLRWREILDLNRSRPQPDGARLGDDTVLHVGWTLALPNHRTSERVEVHAGDTLSALADRYLGDPTRYPELYASNTGRAQPDGHLLDDPDLIRPGWLLRLPDTTTTDAAPDTDTTAAPRTDTGTGTTASPPPPAPAPPPRS